MSETTVTASWAEVLGAAERIELARRLYHACDKFTQADRADLSGECYDLSEDVTAARLGPQEDVLVQVTLTLCEQCLNGDSGQCHTAGCALWLNRAPDLPLYWHAAMAPAPAGDGGQQ
jgi:hypothetical protein